MCPNFLAHLWRPEGDWPREDSLASGLALLVWYCPFLVV